MFYELKFMAQSYIFNWEFRLFSSPVRLFFKIRMAQSATFVPKKILYKIEIHPNFDNHSHAQARDVSETVDFTFNKEWNDIRGKKNADIHHHEIKIPINATPGHYHLMVYCTDVAGNESHVAISVELSHEEGEHHQD
jgi:hypothetical protein